MLTRAARANLPSTPTKRRCDLRGAPQRTALHAPHKTPRRTMPPMDEARRARLQAKLDAETLKGTLANKVRASPMTRRRPTPAVIAPGLNLELPNPYSSDDPDDSPSFHRPSV